MDATTSRILQALEEDGVDPLRVFGAFMVCSSVAKEQKGSEEVMEFLRGLIKLIAVVEDDAQFEVYEELGYPRFRIELHRPPVKDFPDRISEDMDTLRLFGLMATMSAAKGVSYDILDLMQALPSYGTREEMREQYALWRNMGEPILVLEIGGNDDV